MIKQYSYADDLAFHKLRLMKDNEPEYKRFDHIMLDCETVSLAIDAAIAQIVMIPFSVDYIGEAWDYRVNIEDQLKDGRKMSLDTMRFWFQQDNTTLNNVIFRELDGHAVPAGYPSNIATSIARKIQKDWPGVKVWAKPAGADLVWMRSFMEQYNNLGNCIPWKWYNQRCMLTALAVSGDEHKITRKEAFVPHHAVSDCVAQIANLTKACKLLGIELA